MSQGLQESLLSFLKCGVCLEQIEKQKTLPCQHRICLPCVKQLPTKYNRFKCPQCTKEVDIPKGGVQELPDSTDLLRIAQIVKNEPSADKSEKAAANEGKLTQEDISADNQSSSTGSLVSKDLPNQIPLGSFGTVPKTDAAAATTLPKQTVQPPKSKKPRKKKGKQKTTSVQEQPARKAQMTKEQRRELKSNLTETTDSANKRLKNAIELSKYYGNEKENLKEEVQSRKDEIIAYRTKITKLCNEKLQGLNKLSTDRTEELEKVIARLTPTADRLKEAIKKSPTLSKKLVSDECSEDSVIEAQTCLETMKQACQDDSLSKGPESMASEFARGDSVRLAYNEEIGAEVEDFVKSSWCFSEIGIFRGALLVEEPHPFSLFMNIETQMPLVCFPGKPDWKGRLERISHSLTDAKLPIHGKTVRIKTKVTDPYSGWQGLSARKSRGVLREIRNEGPKGDLIVIVDFPQKHGWKGLYSELELVEGCGLEVGDKVRVNAKIPKPERGWGSVNGSSVGEVKEIEGSKEQEEVVVEFPECKEWVGFANELEISRRPFSGEKVQVKLTVETPKLGWGGIKHDDVGMLREILKDDEMGEVGQIWFSNRRKKWSCMLDELEPARYQQPEYVEENTGDGLLNLSRLAALRW